MSDQLVTIGLSNTCFALVLALVAMLVKREGPASAAVSFALGARTGQARHATAGVDSRRTHPTVIGPRGGGNAG